jgi:uncharacterized OB-fold protein
MSATESQLPIGEPRPTPETEPFWSAAAEQRLELPVCDECGLVIWYPRSFCPDCQTDDVTWTPMSGGGTVYSYTVTRGGVGGRWRHHLPFVVAYVQLDEGPIVLTNVVDTDPDTVHIGMPVTAVFDQSPADDEGVVNTVLRFRAD